MAFNTAALKGLFSKLKPAAKTVANYGDDAAKALTTYGDDAARMAFANADDLAAATAQTDDIAKRIRDVDAPVLWDSNNVPDGLDFDIVETSDDYGLSEFNFPINGARNSTVGNTDELISYLNNADAELDSLSQLDPDAYKSGLNGTPDFSAMDVRPSKFAGYTPDLEGSFTFPDGFVNPDAAAMYYDSLERGYIPKEWGKSGPVWKDMLSNFENTGWTGGNDAITVLGDLGADAYIPLDSLFKADKRKNDRAVHDNFNMLYQKLRSMT